MKHDGDPFFKYVKKCLADVMSSLLGNSGLSVLEYHLNRKLGGDMYEAFYESPHAFYLALKSFFGSGADAILNIVAKKLWENGKIAGLSPKEFVELMKQDKESNRQKILDSLRGGVT